MSNRELYEAIIGPSKTTYYLAYFERADTRGYAPLSWNWPAFFLGIFWLLYRKQYQWALIFFLFPNLAMAISYLPNLLGIEGIGNPIFLILVFGFMGVYIPLFANGLYYKWAKSKIEKSESGVSGEVSLQEFLRNRGGVNRNLPFMVVLTILLITMLAPLSQAPA